MNAYENDVPITEDFLAGVKAEKEHQLRRWGTTHDRNKAPADWFWLLGYLSGKALAAVIKGDREKALHHCISSAAVLANWHDAIKNGGPSLKVEHDPSRAYDNNPDPTRPSDVEKHLAIMTDEERIRFTEGSTASLSRSMAGVKVLGVADEKTVAEPEKR